MKNNLLCLALSVSLAFATIDASAQDWGRAYRNYMSIVGGQKSYSDLPPAEQQEVIQFMMLLNTRSGSEDENEECQSARDDAESAADELESTARRLLNCVLSRDFDDDCDSEFRRTRSAHDDYSSAVSEVQSECD